MSVNVNNLRGIPRPKDISLLTEEMFPVLVQPLLTGLRVHIVKDGDSVFIRRWNGEAVSKKDFEDIAFEVWDMAEPQEAIFDGVIVGGKFKVMDILSYEGEWLCDKPLSERREHLSKCQFGEHTEVVLSREVAALEDLENVEVGVVKPLSSTYIPDCDATIDWFVYRTE